MLPVTKYIACGKHGSTKYDMLSKYGGALNLCTTNSFHVWEYFTQVLYTFSYILCVNNVGVSEKYRSNTLYKLYSCCSFLWLYCIYSWYSWFANRVMYHLNLLKSTTVTPLWNSWKLSWVIKRYLDWLWAQCFSLNLSPKETSYKYLLLSLRELLLQRRLSKITMYCLKEI